MEEIKISLKECRNKCAASAVRAVEDLEDLGNLGVVIADRESAIMLSDALESELEMMGEYCGIDTKEMQRKVEGFTRRLREGKEKYLTREEKDKAMEVYSQVKTEFRHKLEKE